jgi:hypothetical protein
VIQSFAPAGATLRQIQLRAARTRPYGAARETSKPRNEGDIAMGATTTAITTPPERLQQRLDALARANEIRIQRAQLKRDLKGSRKAIEDVLSHPPDYLTSATILDLLIWTPKRKRIKASRVLRRCQITPSRTVGALTERQRHIILDELQCSGS